MAEIESNELRSTVGADGSLTVEVATRTLGEPGPDEVLVKVGAAPINPSDLGVFLGMARPDSLANEGPKLVGEVAHGAMAAMGARLDKALPVGNEGAGIVVAAGSNAEHLVGRTVSAPGGGMYSQYKMLPAMMCLPLAEGATPEQGASSFVNPLTALGMVETMRMEGHTGLVHTAAASNLGQMLHRICADDGVPLVNVVRRPEQVDLLRSLGAEHVVDSSSNSFFDDLVAAIVATEASLAFDAVGGGELLSVVLTAMERAQSQDTSGDFSPYGSTKLKQGYIYGGLDRSPTQLSRTYGMAWAIGGWLLPPFLGKVGAEVTTRLQERVAAELTTTFASNYTATLTLEETLELNNVSKYAVMATGEKYLVTPHGADFSTSSGL